MINRLFSILILTGSLLLSAAALEAAPKFVPGINDLPLMPGLVLKSEAPVVFDTPGGRIVEVFAVGAVSLQRIRAFYLETLPQLGWKPGADSQFQRDRELLKIEISAGKAGQHLVRYSVVPITQ